MARRSMLRAADHDREAVAERLRKATAEGRLLAEELEERLGAAFSARTYGELEALVADLPWDDGRRRRRSPATLAVAMLLVLAVMVIVAAVVFLFVTGIAFVLVWIGA